MLYKDCVLGAVQNGWIAVVLTVQMAVADALHVLCMNELVASLPHNVDWRQVHVVTDSERNVNGVTGEKKKN